MKHLHAYIVKPFNGRYNNKKKVGDKELILNTSVEDHKYVQRMAVVIEPPINNPKYKKDDILIVHHNLFRRFYDARGNEKNSRAYIEEGVYACFEDQIFLYKREEKWNTPDGFCFVKPLVNQDIFSTEKEEQLKGVVIYNNDKLEGVNDNDIIGFTPNSEYEFIIDDQKLYRVPLNSIAIKYDGKRTEKEYNPSWL